MTWNHRVVRRVWDSGETTYAIHEAYYELGQLADSITNDPVAVVGDNVEELRTTLQWMLNSLDKPVLNYEDIVGEK